MKTSADNDGFSVTLGCTVGVRHNVYRDTEQKRTVLSCKRANVGQTCKQWARVFEGENSVRALPSVTGRPACPTATRVHTYAFTA